MRILLLILCLLAGSAGAAPTVVTSIPPLQEITTSIMHGVGEAQSIVAEGSSSHHFALRPSHMRKLQQADLVIWIDRHFEAGFARIAETLPGSTAQLELLPALDMEGADGHIWFSPRRLDDVITLISKRLIELDADNRSVYESNAARLGAEIENWRVQTVQRLQQRPPRYLTDHAFTAHFEADMGHPPIASVHDQHDDHGGLHELDEIEAQLRAQPARCLLTLEPSSGALARELAKKYQLEIIDLGAGGRQDSDAPPIVQRLQQFADALEACAG